MVLNPILPFLLSRLLAAAGNLPSILADFLFGGEQVELYDHTLATLLPVVGERCRVSKTAKSCTQVPNHVGQ